MSTARTLVLLEIPVRETVRRIAKKEGVSLSSKCRDLILEALELEEDLHWDRVAQNRQKNPPKRYLTHREIFGKLA